ncbi:MAG: hypothetical protein VYC34_01365, partial [Planctomycetota bacterium]|nr:hypothetical protein [Planctomycetota bacterium]
RIGESMRGDGSLFTYSRDGRQLVALGVTPMGDGAIGTFSNAGGKLVSLTATPRSEGVVQVYDARERRTVVLPDELGVDGAVAEAK